MPRKFFLLLLVLVIGITTCAAPKKVVRRGVVMTEDEAAKLDYKQIEKTSGTKRSAQTLIDLEKFIRDYPDHRLSAHALHKIAKLHAKTKNTKKMTVALEKLIERFPLSEIADDGKYQLGKIYLKNKQNSEAKTVLSAVNLSKFSTEKKLRVLKYLRKSLQLTESWRELIYCNTKIYDLSTEFSELNDLKNETFSIIEAKLTPQQLYDLAKDRKGSYPGDIALWKLSKIAFHIREFKNAKSYLSYFLKTYPLSEYYGEAETLYERLMSRKSTDPKTIGLLLPLTGPHAAIGEMVMKGIWLASGLYSSANKPYDDYRIIVKDTAGDPDTAARVFDELVFDEGTIGIVGPMLTKTSEAVALKAQEYGTPIILLNQSENITEIGDYVFRNFITKSEQTKILAKFTVEELGIKRFAFLYPRHNYGIAFVNSFWNELEKYPEVEVRGSQSYDPTTDDFSKPIKRLFGLSNLKFRKDEICRKDFLDKWKDVSLDELSKVCYEASALPPVIDFEALIIPDNYEKIMQIAPSLAYYDVKALQLIGGNLWNSESLLKDSTDKYLQGSILTDAFFKHSKNPIIKEFSDKFFQTFDEEPIIISSHAHEAISVMLFAAKGAGSSNDLRNILANEKNFNIISGNTSFDSERNLQHNLSILVVDGRKIKELY